VVSVFERDRKLLEYLESTGIRPGVQLEVLAAHPGIHLKAGERTVRLERNVASKVWVKAV
jgi:Fe2+ transport system protein FeoA